MTKPVDIDSYIASFPAEIAGVLQQFREIVNEAAPDAAEVISYGIPAFRLPSGMLAWFAAHTNHIGFYPRGSGIEEFKEDLAGYKVSKGTIQFPLGQPLPIELIQKIIHFRVAEDQRKAYMKKSK